MTRQPAENFTIAFTVRERLVLEELRLLAALASEADVIRLALQNLADHYDIKASGTVFAFRGRRYPRAKVGAA